MIVKEDIKLNPHFFNLFATYMVSERYFRFLSKEIKRQMLNEKNLISYYKRDID